MCYNMYYFSHNRVLILVTQYKKKEKEGVWGCACRFLLGTVGERSRKQKFRPMNKAQDHYEGASRYDWIFTNDRSGEKMLVKTVDVDSRS